MKTPEEIKKGLECMANSDIECDVCPYRDDSYLFCSTGIVKDAIACIQQLERDKNWASENYDLISEENKRLEAQVPKWISVEDRLPEKHRCVLVHLCWGAIATGVHNGRNWWDELSLVNNDNVTHWMPLPEPPEECNDEKR